MVLESCADMVCLSGMVASGHRPPSVHLPPTSAFSSPVAFCSVRICPSLATTSGAGVSAGSSPSCSSVVHSSRSFGTGSRRRKATCGAAASSFLREESDYLTSSCLLRLPPASSVCSLSRDRDKIVRPVLWRKRLASSLSRGLNQRTAAAEEAELVEEQTDDESLFDLEAEIFEFMQKSGKPSDFPSKDDLKKAGRMDLVEAIATHGGWLAYGWDIEDVDDPTDRNYIKGDAGRKWVKLNGNEPDTEDGSCFSLPDAGEHEELSFDCYDDRIRGKEMFSSSAYIDSLSTPSSSGRSIDSNAGDESGIDGILRRLDKERILSYTVASKDSNTYHSVGGISRVRRNFSAEDQMQGFEKFEERFVNGKTNGVANVLYDFGDSVGNSKESDFSTEKYAQNHIQSRLLVLESELSSVLSSLRSQKDNTVLSSKGIESSQKEVHGLADAQEFVETEMMKAQDKLRSTRAKISVLEGKMAHQMIELQKIIEEKQRRIDATQRVLNLLRTAYISWPNSATEVFLAGTFDGWSSQRRMEKSSSGVFSLLLKLYPGQYEIKFIVDGVWKVDPLRPIVCNHGFENNILTVL